MSGSIPQDDVFEGFPYPDEGDFTRVPNDFFAYELARINNMAELKVILYTMRHTWGFQEYESYKKITIEEFAKGRMRKDGTRLDDGTGLGITAVKDGVRKAVEHGYLIADLDESNPWRKKKCYRLKMVDDD